MMFHLAIPLLGVFDAIADTRGMEALADRGSWACLAYPSWPTLWKTIPKRALPAPHAVRAHVSGRSPLTRKSVQATSRGASEEGKPTLDIGSLRQLLGNDHAAVIRCFNRGGWRVDRGNSTTAACCRTSQRGLDGPFCLGTCSGLRNFCRQGLWAAARRAWALPGVCNHCAVRHCTGLERFVRNDATQAGPRGKPQVLRRQGLGLNGRTLSIRMSGWLALRATPDAQALF